MESFRGRRYYHGMGHLLLSVFFLAAGAESRRSAPEKGAPASTRSGATAKPPPQPPGSHPPTKRTKTAMA